jgi:hypothetical protein
MPLLFSLPPARWLAPFGAGTVSVSGSATRRKPLFPYHSKSHSFCEILIGNRARYTTCMDQKKERRLPRSLFHKCRDCLFQILHGFLVIFLDSIDNAAIDMIAEDNVSHAAQRRVDSRNLDQDIAAVTAFRPPCV